MSYDHGWPPLQSDLEVSDVLRAVEEEKERAHYEEEEEDGDDDD